MANSHPGRRRRAKNNSIGQVVRNGLKACLFVPFAILVGAFIVACLITRTVAVSSWRAATFFLGTAPVAKIATATVPANHLSVGVGGITPIAPTS